MKLLELVLAEQFLRRDKRHIDLEIIQGLIDFGVDINIPHLRFNSYTSSHSALLLCNLIVKLRRGGPTRDVSNLITLLVGRGAIIDADVVEAAVTETGLGILPELAGHGADIGAQGGLALCTAARLNNFEAVSWLLQVGVDINADIDRMNWAMPQNQQNRLAVYELLLRRGCPVLGDSGLASYIYHGGRHEVIYKVLDAGADVNACSRKVTFGYGLLYPLQSAATRGDLELVKQLLQRGALINQPPLGFRGQTALQGACEWDTLSTEERARKMDLVKLLINQGADVNAPAAQDYGMTALQIAAIYGDIELALVLLEHGANPNAPPARFRGHCALDAAALQGRLDMVDLLLSAAAHSYHRGQSGYEGAIGLATENGHFAVADLIREHIRLFGNCVVEDLNDDRCPLLEVSESD
ncbi:ankyrin repeat-containing domain protein [Xylaria flabelliformis]|nr:ankyrin repeat-containing domain protein [Xylaria flabelliformis]